MDLDALAAFLRTRRERVRPTEVGLPAGRRRRTPGLRREEVAQLAHVSVEYVARLEQARGSRPSREVLVGLARALRLSDAESDHLHYLAGVMPAPATGPNRVVRQSLQDLLDRLPDAAAIVISAAYEVIGWNALAAALMEDFSSLSRRDRNLVRRAFLGPHREGRRLYGVSDVDEFARTATNDLRAAVARYPDDRELTALVEELRRGSEDFEALWNAHDVDSPFTLHKEFDHPRVGPVSVSCDVLDVAASDQRVVIYTATPGSRSQQALRLLAVLGTQDLETAP